MTTVPDSDRLTRFLLEHAGVRGVRVHLGDAWREIAGRDANDLRHREVASEIVGLLTAEAVIARNLTMGIAWHRFTTWFNIWFKREDDGSNPKYAKLAPEKKYRLNPRQAGRSYGFGDMRWQHENPSEQPCA